MQVDRRTILRLVMALPLLGCKSRRASVPTPLPALYRHNPDRPWDNLINFPSQFASELHKQRAVAEWKWCVKCGYKRADAPGVKVKGRTLYIWRYDPSEPWGPRRRVVEAVQT